MLDINKEKNRINPQRAPQKREAPVPLRGPMIDRRRKPTMPSPSKLNELFKGNALQFEQGTGFHGGPSAKRKGYRLALWSWLASLIDALILVSASCVFMLMFSLIVKSSIGGILQGFSHEQHRWIFFAEVYALSSWFYMITVRGIMGSTIGEWACDLRLGQPHERLQSGLYILRVILRSSLILLTGVITLPLLSLIFGKDIPGLCSGLRLFSLK